LQPLSVCYGWTLLGSIENDYNTQTLARSRSVGEKTSGFTLFVASLAAFHLSWRKASPQVKSPLEKRKRKVQHLRLNKSLEQGLNLSGS